MILHFYDAIKKKKKWLYYFNIIFDRAEIKKKKV